MNTQGSGKIKTVVAAAAGNFVEWYDFAIYGYFSPVLAKTFFPDSDELTGLLATLAIFGAAFVLRPVGAVVFGHLGDKRGRRWVLSIVILTMSGATTLIGALPSFATAGVLAPILLTVLRLVQGLSAGGEFGGAASLLFEHAPPRRRGLFGSTQPASIAVALALSAGLGTALTSWMSHDFLYSTGWRIPFLLGLPLGIGGWYIRRHVEETPSFTAMQEQGEVADSPVKDVFRGHWRMVAAGTAAIVSWTAGGYVTLQFLPTFFDGVLERNLSEGLTASLVGLTAYAGFIVLGGWLSDRIARWKVMLTGAVAVAVLAIPCYQLLIRGGALSIGLAVVLFAASLGLTAGPTPAMLSELTPGNVRNSYLSIVYSIANAAFGGFAPYIVTALIDSSGDRLSPAYYLIGLEALAVAGLVGVGGHLRKHAGRPETGRAEAAAMGVGAGAGANAGAGADA
ncbi:MFS transporter [Streptomyces sp. 4503]|uniref:MFS transporter n=1 Tax=Streptomyces niphimycinicus TaxID=2842201 RepID=A0ABS6CDV2_9ACTN|nr:MFS transporter [Streptomyces niphimycinicus]MBU3865063.1 MFS transporter [Streptomyces niphimycinicus]